MAKNNRKESKPYPDFPLTAHRNGQWCKKIRGRIHYFGSDADAALEKYLAQRDDLQAGRQPTTTTDDRLTLRELVNHYLTNAENRRDAGELSPLSFRDYHWTAKQMLAQFGESADPSQIRPLQFTEFRAKLAKRFAPSRLAKTVTVTRMILRWGYESELMDRPPRFGPDFKSTSKKAARIAKAAAGSKALPADGIRKLLEIADPGFKAMILLGINGAFGNTDIATLRLSAVDLESGWIQFPRPKTGIRRRIPLWPQTVAALRTVIHDRPRPAKSDFQERVFLTTRGQLVVTVTPSGRRVDKITIRFRELLQACELYRKGLGFYCLRHTFQTVGDSSKDPLAVSSIMGHVDGTISGMYRQEVAADRLVRVSQHVRQWLFELADSDAPFDT